MKIDQRAIERKLAQRLVVILQQETDEAFRQKAFDGVAWQPTKYPVKQGSLLLRSALLRRSLSFRVNDNTVVVSSSVPYATLHNEGGVVSVPVTDKMRRFFFAMHKKSKEPRYLAMALSRKTSYSIRIPRRQFVGIQGNTSQRLQKALKALDKMIEPN